LKSPPSPPLLSCITIYNVKGAGLDLRSTKFFELREDFKAKKKAWPTLEGARLRLN
jgi:hypothetical protein